MGVSESGEEQFCLQAGGLRISGSPQSSHIKIQCRHWLRREGRGGVLLIRVLGVGGGEDQF